MGIHKGFAKFNLGTLIKSPIDEFNQIKNDNNNFNDLKKIEDNKIKVNNNLEKEEILSFNRIWILLLVPTINNFNIEYQNKLKKIKNVIL